MCLTLCYFVLVFFSPFSIVITSLGEERANLSAFRTFVRFVLVWIFLFPLPLSVWEGLRFVIVALTGLLSYLYFCFTKTSEHVSLFVDLPAVTFNGLHTLKSISVPFIKGIIRVNNTTTSTQINCIVYYLKYKIILLCV